MQRAKPSNFIPLNVAKVWGLGIMEKVIYGIFSLEQKIKSFFDTKLGQPKEYGFLNQTDL